MKATSTAIDAHMSECKCDLTKVNCNSLKRKYHERSCLGKSWRSDDGSGLDLIFSTFNGTLLLRPEYQHRPALIYSSHSFLLHASIILTASYLSSMTSSIQEEFEANNVGRRTIFVAAALILAGICSLHPRGIYRDYDRNEIRKQSGRVREVDDRQSRSRQWQRHRDREDLANPEDEPLPSRRARYHSSRDGKSVPPRSRDYQDPDFDYQPRRRQGHHHAQSPKKEEKDPFS